MQSLSRIPVQDQGAQLPSMVQFGPVRSQQGEVLKRGDHISSAERKTSTSPGRTPGSTRGAKSTPGFIDLLGNTQTVIGGLLIGDNQSISCIRTPARKRPDAGDQDGFHGLAGQTNEWPRFVVEIGISQELLLASAISKINLYTYFLRRHTQKSSAGALASGSIR